MDTFLRVKTEEKGPDAEDINNDGDSIYDHNYSETGGRCIIMDGYASVRSVVHYLIIDNKYSTVRYRTVYL